MSANVLLQAIGLMREPNQLNLPEGSLTTASNVIIRRDNVIESRRGYKLYGTDFGTSTDRAKQLFTYKNRIIRHFASSLEFDTLQPNSLGQSVFQLFAGSYTEPRAGQRIRSIEANSNFYFTTSDGVKKISASSADQFTSASGYITNAGGIKALDLTTRLKIKPGDQSSWFVEDSTVAYRVVWGIRDANNNLILGTPSQRQVVVNPLQNLVLEDFARVLGALDDTANNVAFPSLISDTDYVSSLILPINSSANQLQINLIALAQKLDNDILYADDVAVAPLQISSTTISTGVATVNFATGNPQDYLVSGSQIFLSGFIPTTGTLDGAQVVSTVTPTTITFNTSATGPVTLSSPTINDDEFRSLTIPGVPSIPATDQQLRDLQTYLQNILILLQNEPDTGTPPTISADSQTEFISPLDITTTATVILDITIPQGVTTNHFFQVYRSALAIATGPSSIGDISPNDELQQVYEAFPTSADISAGHVSFEDITPDAFRGANLYTNATTGEGILQANDLPPVAVDINRFKNVVFYANTRTRHRLTINLLGVSTMITDYNNSITPSIVISDGTTSNTYTFVTGLPETTDITTTGGGTLNASGTASYFYLNASEDFPEYYVWYKIGTATDPAIVGRTGIEVEANAGDSANQIAEKTALAIARQIQDFMVSFLANVVTVININDGITTDATAETSGFGIVVTQQGRGEDASTRQVLLSTSASPAIAVDETARSLVRIINKNTNETVNAFYLSGAGDVPGQILLEERSLSIDAFYILGNNSNTGLSFSPDISPETTIASISVANPTVITTNTPHGLINQDKVVIVASDSTPSVDGVYPITYISTTSFSIPVNVTVAGTTGAIRRASTAVVSDDENQSNRIYYSKYLQPEAVPIVNTIDVGATDKAILRIFPLRDTLFVFKEDGLFRISGESSPFNLALFDSSVITVAPDTIDVSNNVIYGFTTQGIMSITEAGASNPPISRPIDVDILPLVSSDFPGFASATWGMGYESDNSYTFYTVSERTDEVGTIGYRYSTLTNSWTTFDRSATCGIVDPADGKQYLGAGDTNFIEQERKDFSRYDYADREMTVQLETGNYFGTNLRLSNITGIDAGDVVVQEQYVTVYDFNSQLKKMDIDPTLTHTYETNLTIAAGVNIRTQVDSLLDQLANDPIRLAQSGATLAATYEAFQSITTVGTITNISADNPTKITCTAHGLQNGRIITIAGSNSSPSIDNTWAVTVVDANTFSIPISVKVPGTTGTFTVENDDFKDVQASFNVMIRTMNNDLGVAFSNYRQLVDLIIQEAIIVTVTNINNLSKNIDLNLKLDYLIGPLIIFNAINTEVVWAPNTLGDALGLKHMREATLIFSNKAFTSSIMSFSTDLLPQPIQVPFNGDGNGIFGFSGNTKGFGSNFFGGGSNSAPFRTYVPRDCQRCRFLICKFTHKIAREQYAIYGLSLTGEISQSTRAYR